MHDVGVLYVDTGNNFSARRVFQILEEQLRRSGKQDLKRSGDGEIGSDMMVGKGKDLRSILKKIRVVKVFDAFQLHDLLLGLQDSFLFGNKVRPAFPHTRLMLQT